MGQVIGGVVERIGCVVCVKHLVQHKVLRGEGVGAGGRKSRRSRGGWGRGGGNRVM